MGHAVMVNSGSSANLVSVGALFFKKRLATTAKETFIAASGLGQIAFNVRANQAVVHGTVGGKPLTLQVDSGAGATMLYQDAADRLGIRAERPTVVSGWQGKINAAIGTMPDLTFGTVGLGELETLIVGRAPVSGSVGAGQIAPLAGLAVFFLGWFLLVLGLFRLFLLLGWRQV